MYDMEYQAIWISYYRFPTNFVTAKYPHDVSISRHLKYLKYMNILYKIYNIWVSRCLSVWGFGI